MRAVVLGVNGQDGSYLAEHLLRRGYVVYGVARQSNSRHVPAQAGYRHVPCDMTNPVALKQVLEEAAADLVFHAAAVHGSAGFRYEPVAVETLMVNSVSVLVALEYLRCNKPDGFLFYASSAKVFSTPVSGMIDENWEKKTSCIYSFTKNSAEELISFYRQQHGIGASVAYLFQHESPRRAETYFIPRICSILYAALQGQATKGSVATLDFYCDWGAAEEYMDIAVSIATERLSDDFILASGVTWHARKFVETLFASHDLDWAEFVSEMVVENGFPPDFQVSTAHLERRLGKKPQTSILSVCDDIVRMKSASV